MSIPCNTRTHLGGENGAGKTSTLALIPAFYGQEHDRLINRGSGKLSFLEYYLPTPQSLIIFEYRRDDGLCCAVMYRHQTTDTSQIRYRFVKGAAAATFFSDNIKVLMSSGTSAGDVINAIADTGISVSGPIRTIKDYRAIIQRNPRLLSQKAAEARKMRALAAEFGLGTANSNMSHIEKLTNVVLNKSQLMSSFKEMICDTQFDHIHLHQRPNAIDSRGLINDISSVSDFEKETDKMRECLVLDGQRQANDNHIRSLGHALTATVALEEERLSALRQEIRDTENEIIRLQDAHEDSQSALKRAIADARIDLEKTEADYDDLHSQRERYDQSGTPELARKADNLAILRANEAEAKIEYERLSGQQNEIREQHEAEKRRLQDEHHQRRGMLLEEIAKAEKRLAEAEQKHERTVLTEQANLGNKIAEFRESRQAGRELLQNRVIELETVINNIGPSQHQVEQQELAEAKVAQAHGARDKTREDIEQCGHKLRLAAQARQDALDALKDAEAVHRIRLENRDELRRIMHPEDGSWLSQLRQQDPQWATKLGKVVRPDLLYRKDLAPEYQASAAVPSLYGWVLQLEGEPAPQHALAEDELQRRLQTLDEEVSVAKHAVTAIEKDVKTSTEQLQDRERELEQVKIALNSHDRNLKAAQSELQLISDRIRKAVDDTLTKARTELESKTRDLAAYTVATDEGVAEITRDHQALLLELKSHWADSQQNLTVDLEARTQSKIEADEQHRQRLARLEDAYEQACRDTGIDPQLISDARKRLASLQAEIKSITDNLDEIDRFKRWQQVQWPRIEELQARIASLKGSLGQLLGEQREHERVHKAAVEALRDKRSYCQNQSRDLDSGLGLARNLLEKIDLGESDGAAPGDLEMLTNDLQERLAAQHKLRGQVLKMFRDAKAIINRYDSSQIAMAWKKRTRERQIMRGYDASIEGTEAFDLEQVSDIRGLLDVEIPMLRQTLVGNFISEASRFENYYGSLRVVVAEVEAVSRKLGRQINLDQRIESLSDIRIRLTPRIHDDEAWEPLKAFVKEWEDWKLLNRNELPPLDLLRLFRAVDDGLRAAHAGTSIASLIDMTIEMRENDRDVIIRTDNDFASASSTGLTYLAIMAIFMSMTRYLCPDQSVRITWPVDELGTLSENNIARLADMLEQHNLTMISACPTLDSGLRKFFENKFRIHKGRIQEFVATPTPATSGIREYLMSQTQEEAPTHAG
ncbi:ATP-binding protein [Marinobacter sp. X15-166B]|uniref:ATP-binding protein n=1 Tax=Marinobacter sp. X15-166B TaxID=1897620 RepID=UPI0013015EC3|nr:ATP-binding protein [Marinobacter sp. X15-166B]